MRALTVVIVGQAVSFIGTGMTRFAIMYWAFEETGSATSLALLGFASFAPLVIVSPVAGALVDRSNRKLVMMLSDLAAGLATVALLILYTLGELEILPARVRVAARMVVHEDRSRRGLCDQKAKNLGGIDLAGGAPPSRDLAFGSWAVLGVDRNYEKTLDAACHQGTPVAGKDRLTVGKRGCVLLGEGEGAETGLERCG